MLRASPYFDPAALRHELTAIFSAKGDPDKTRTAVIARLKELVLDARGAARAALEIESNGRKCAASISHFQDELIRLIFDCTVAHVYRTVGTRIRHRSVVFIALQTNALGRERC
jgi:[protein-PII] uridylyltransferase